MAHDFTKENPVSRLEPMTFGNRLSAGGSYLTYLIGSAAAVWYGYVHEESLLRKLILGKLELS